MSHYLSLHSRIQITRMILRLSDVILDVRCLDEFCPVFSFLLYFLMFQLISIDLFIDLFFLFFLYSLGLLSLLMNQSIECFISVTVF